MLIPNFVCLSRIPGLFPKSEEISAMPLHELLIAIYLFYENWSTETFRGKSQTSGLLSTPTNLWSEVKLSIDDYGKKYCITMALTITPTDFANVLSINGIKYQT